MASGFSPATAADRGAGGRLAPELAQAIFEQAFDAVLIADDERRYVAANDAACRLLGLPRDQVLRLRVEDISDPELRSQVPAIWAGFLAAGEMNGEFTIRRSDGTARLCDFHARANLVPGLHLSVLRDVTELRQAHNALSQSELRFRTSVEHLIDGFGIYTAIRGESGRIVDFRVDYVNEAAFAGDRMTREQQEGHRLLELFPGLAEAGIFDAYVRVVETGEPYRAESAEHEDAFGDASKVRRAFDLKASKLDDGFVATWQDVTRRRQAERELQEAEERRRLVIDHASDAILLVGRSGTIEEANPAAGRLLRSPAPELIGRSWASLAGGCEEEPAHGPEDTGQAGGGSLFERVLRRPDGTTVEVELSTAALADGGYALIVRDIEARRRVEAEHARLVAAIEQSPDAVMVTSPDGVIDYVNAAFEKLSGYARADVVGKHPGIFRPAGAEPDNGHWQHLAGGERWTDDIVAEGADGTDVTAEWAMAPVLDAAGALVGHVAIARDRTRERALEARLLQAAKMEAVGQLAGGIAHDFNNLLTAARGYTELVRSDPTIGTVARADLDEVLAAVDRASALTRQLLAFSRQQVLRSRVVDPSDIVDGILPLLRRLLGEHIRLTAHRPPDPVHVRVDPGQLEQVIVNLAINARDAMPDGGNLTIEVDLVELGPADAAGRPGFVPGRHVCLTVTDTGTGMDSDTMRHIFEPFFTTKEPGMGTGMGLATVYGIVKQSGGFVSVSSEPGQGTTFRIYMPRSDDAPEPSAVFAGGRPTPAGTETVLLVEDEPAVRAFARRALEQQGYTVLEAPGGDAGLALAAAHAGGIDLLVTDLVMPGMLGPELARRLTEIRPLVRTLFISGFAEHSATQRGVLEADVQYLPKPFTADSLGSAVRRALDGPAPRATS